MNEKLLKRIKIAGKKFGIAEIEDLSQEYCLYLLEGKGQHQTIDQFCIEYLRRFSGRKGNKFYSLRQNLHKSYINGQDAFQAIDGGDPRLQWDSRVLLEQCFKFLRTKRQKEIFYLRFLEEYNEAEIADYYQVTESRICQILKGIQSRLSERIEKETPRQRSVFKQLEEILFNKWQEMECTALAKMAKRESRKMESFDGPSFEEWLT